MLYRQYEPIGRAASNVFHLCKHGLWFPLSPVPLVEGDYPLMLPSTPCHLIVLLSRYPIILLLDVYILRWLREKDEGFLITYCKIQMVRRTSAARGGVLWRVDSFAETHSPENADRD